MSTSRGNCIILAQTLGGLASTDSTATLGRSFDETLENLGKMKMPPLIYSSGLAVTTDVRFSFPTDAVEVLAIFFEGRQLYRAEKTELEAWDSDWRDSSAAPLAYYKAESDYETIRMIPYPTTASTGAWLYTKGGLGSELVSNGTFDTATGWTTGVGWSIAAGVADCDGSQTTVSLITSATMSLTTGTVYLVEFTMTRSAGSLYPYIGTGTGTMIGSSSTAAGTFSTELTFTEGTNTLNFSASSDFIGTLDNVSFREAASIPEYLTLYVVFEMLRREYTRLSSHQDKTFAEVCGQISELFSQLAGI